MPTKSIENTTASPLFVGGKLIPPGESRDIDTALLPPEHRDGPALSAEPAAPSLVDLVKALHAHPVKEIVAELPGLTQEAFDLLCQAEKEHAKPRTSLLTALEAERIRRADAQLAADADAAYQRQLAELNPEQLAAVGEKTPAA